MVIESPEQWITPSYSHLKYDSQAYLRLLEQRIWKHIRTRVKRGQVLKLANNERREYLSRLLRFLEQKGIQLSDTKGITISTDIAEEHAQALIRSMTEQSKKTNQELAPLEVITFEDMNYLSQIWNLTPITLAPSAESAFIEQIKQRHPDVVFGILKTKKHLEKNNE